MDLVQFSKAYFLWIIKETCSAKDTCQIKPLFFVFGKGTILKSKTRSYRMYSSLGGGTFGEVFSIVDVETSDVFAVKVISNNEKDDNFPNFSFFIMEYCSKGSLQKDIDELRPRISYVHFEVFFLVFVYLLFN